MVSEGSPLAATLQALGAREGVRRADLYEFLGVELRELWDIRTDKEALEIVSVKLRDAINGYYPKPEGDTKAALGPRDQEAARNSLRTSYCLTGNEGVDSCAARNERFEQYEKLHKGSPWESERGGRRRVADFSRQLAELLESRLLELVQAEGQTTASDETVTV